ncbi:hypothetical protein [uncultured Roseobacter sp.]|uniref:hypothetical protein n=1 Tax=uncultured Roseobacter sp. TaxID=114847 RepID=UPI0026234E36|nr:hypothetical protein [uncultured Roseobacter sp.]
MTLPLYITVAAVILGVFLPLRWGVFGFLGAAALLFTLQAGIQTASGFEGTSIEESLLLFNGSWGAYLGFNAQITYRSFALPLVLMAASVIFRFARATRA